jgi:TolB-like protein/Tfp pilus assembly protein PilF/tRNA A-37 threonylcarbamoyl transferase component Bud32
VGGDLDHVRALLVERYAVRRELGSGGMAVVYLAEDLKHHRQVAIKVFRPELAAVLGGERFLREIEILAQLSHPHILPLHDSGQAGGLLYYVTPYVAAGSLRDRLEREGQLAIGETVQLARDVAEALDYAHGRGVVHRDVKPENILMAEGHAVVTDFGVAVSTGSVERLTTGGLVVGTPAYMSPEQASGEADLDGRSDQYSLACVLYEALAGQPPFTGRNARAIIARQIADPVPPLATVRPEIQPALVHAVERALAKVRQDRYPTMRGFVDALLSTDPVSGPAPPRSVAVLPFVGVGGRPDDVALAEGISEEILSALMKVDGLHVASRTSVSAFREAGQDVQTIGRTLRVGAILEGTVRTADTRLRVTARLVDVADGFHLWSDRYERELADVLAIQDEIAEGIVRSLRVVLSREERRAMRRGRTHDARAYRCYLEGRQFFFRFRRRSLEHARDMFRRAIEIDPQYARAYAGAADCSSFLYLYFGSDRSDLAEAEAASGRALTLAPDLAEGHAARGLAVSLSGQYEDAVRQFETAIQLDPRLFEARYFYARAAFQEGRLDDALRLFEEACHVREDFQARLLWAQCYAALGRESDATAAYRHALRVISEHLDLHPGDTRALMLGAGAWARVGEAARALDWAERALAIDPEDAVVLYGVACDLAVLGLTERALALLEAAVGAGFRKKEWIMNDPDWAGLRSNERFRTIVEGLEGVSGDGPADGR